jgi:antitoxin (DNA-binding transcriptional repressor) of toxin-antitoxin stability system
MSATPTFTVTEFKAKCLDILDRLGSGKLDRVEVTKRGRVMAVLTPPPPPQDAALGLFGFMKGTVHVPEGFDLTAPVIDGPFTVDDGKLHG